MRQASGVAPVRRSRATRCSEATASRVRCQGPRDRAEHVPPILDAGQSTGTRSNCAMLVSRSSMRSNGRRRRDESDGFGPGLVDVAALRHARHHDGATFLRDRALVDVAERPVVEARRRQDRRARRGVRIVAGEHRRGWCASVRCSPRPRPVACSGSAGFRAPAGWAKLRPWMMTSRRLASVDLGWRRRGRRKPLRFRRKRQFLGDARHRVVIAADDEHLDRRPRAGGGSGRPGSVRSSSSLFAIV